VIKYEYKLVVDGELYSYLGELFFLFYKVYKGDLQAREILQNYPDKYDPSYYYYFLSST
jgi:hypothetical protein